MKKIFVFLFVFLGILVAGLIAGFMVIKDDPKVQSYVISKMSGEPIQVAGNINLALGLSEFAITLKDYTIKKEGADKDMVRFETADISFNYWSWLIGNRNFKTFEISNGFLDVTESIKPITFTQASRTDDVLKLNGKIGPEILKVQKQSDTIDISLGKLNIKGELDGRFTSVENLIVTINDHAIGGSVDIDGDEIEASLNVDTHAPMTFEMKQKRHKDIISLHADTLRYEDIQTIQNVVKDIEPIIKNVQKPQTQEPEFKQKLYRIDIDKLSKNDLVLGSIKLLMEDNEETVTIETDGTRLAGADFNSQILLHRDKTQASKIDVSWKDFDYLKLMQAFGQNLPVQMTSKASLDTKITLKGDNEAQWRKSANGTIRLRFNESEFDGRLIDLWGAGLVNYMIPSFDKDTNTKMYCAILNIDITDGIARIEPVAMDTKRVTVFGKGKYDIVENNLEIRIKPKSKGIALGDIATAIKITGPIENPSIGTDKLSALQKVGELALGAINPAFFVFSLTDLGLDEEDICQSN